MDFQLNTVSAILATVISAGILALISVAWRHREKIKAKWFSFEKRESPTETVDVEKFIKNVHRWRSKNPDGISLSITQSNASMFTTRFEKITEIDFIRKAAPEKNLLILKFSESSDIKQRTTFVATDEFSRICRLLYFKEVKTWKPRL